MDENEIAHEVVDFAYRVCAASGAGLLESAYEAVLAFEPGSKNSSHDRKFCVAATYRGIDIGAAFRADLVADGRVIGELRSTESVLAIHEEQLLTCLRLRDERVGARMA